MPVVIRLMNDRLLVPTFLCPRPWASMPGDELTRYCDYCRKCVHNLTHPDSPGRAELLGDPAARLCGRYRAAIRRARPEFRAAYFRHLAKCGAGVAAAGAAAVVLWEISTEPGHSLLRWGRHDGMPSAWYEERQTHLVGDIACPPAPPTVDDDPGEPAAEPPPATPLAMPTAEIDRLFGEPARARAAITAVERVPINLPPAGTGAR